MAKKHLYFVPGLGASTQIFEHLSFDDTYECHFIPWKIPLSTKETLSDYAKRMCEEVHHKNSILVGVSFGGIMVQEMSTHITVEKIILISSIKSKHELPKALKIAKVAKIYKLIPTKMVKNIEDYTKYFFGDYLKKRAELYKMYLSVRDPKYIEWAIYNVLHWNQEAALPNTLHIHGTEDQVFPLKYIDGAVEVNKGTHVMILTKAKTIANLISNALV